MHVENNTVVRPAAADDDDEERQRSLLQTLWNEASSTTDLPSNDHSRLHHRRAKSAETEYNVESSSSSSPGKHKRHPHGVVVGGGGTRYRVSRGSKIAKRVWLTAFAACATSFLIALHVFLYRVFVGHNVVINATRSGEGGSSIAAMGGMEKKNGMPILAVEDQEAKMTLIEAHAHRLAPITEHSIDTLQYTIRINTWQRNEQLLLSVNHHAKCEGVAQIHVIWCDDANDPPDEIVHHVSGKVKVEKHVINSLNERFKVLMDTPTLGILSLDDDVLRPCVALDAAFLRWTRHPDRMVGFDARTHVVVGNEDAGEDGSSSSSNNNNNGDNSNKSKWKYGYMSTTESSNRYSITLPRASFIHRDYLDLYIMALPRSIYSYVAQNLECEDVAMSFLVSSLTGGKSPLLADYWAVKSMVKMYSTKKISGGKDHKATRDACVNDFAQLLGLKEDGEWPLQTGKLLHKDKFFGYGTESEEWSNIEVGTILQSSSSSARLQDVVKKMQQLQTLSSNERMNWLANEKATTTTAVMEAGMIENTPEWKKRWSSHTQ